MEKPPPVLEINPLHAVRRRADSALLLREVQANEP
jgi:hypothetical protein